MQKALIVVSIEKKKAFLLKNKIVLFLKENKIESDIYTYDGFSHIPDINESYSFAICLGGDGSVLFTARYCAPRKIPVFPINFGRFGFIASIEPKDWQKELEAFIKGKCEMHKRMLIYSSVIRKGKTITRFEALNDIVISCSGIAKLINLEISFNGISFGTYRADGVIVSTPTGSTAYSAASGGPILDPDVSAFVLTPISPFSLSNRPIVLPSSGKMSITAPSVRPKSIVISVDGQELYTVNEGDTIEISQSKNKVMLAGCSPTNFYAALNSKLGWTGSAISKKISSPLNN